MSKIVVFIILITFSLSVAKHSINTNKKKKMTSISYLKLGYILDHIDTASKKLYSSHLHRVYLFFLICGLSFKNARTIYHPLVLIDTFPVNMLFTYTRSIVVSLSLLLSDFLIIILYSNYDGYQIAASDFLNMSSLNDKTGPE